MRCVLLFVIMCVGLVNVERLQYTSTALRMLGKKCKVSAIQPTADTVDEVERHGIRKHRKCRGGQLRTHTGIIPVRITQRDEAEPTYHTTTERIPVRCEIHQTTTDKPSSAALLINARSIRSTGLVVRQQIELIRPQLVFITETWNKPDYGNVHFASMLPDTYLWCNVDRVDKRGGGVAIAYDNRLQCREYSRMMTAHCEYLWCTVNVNYTAIDIVTVYREPSGSFANFCDAFQELLEQLSEKKKDVIITGDFNLHVDDPSSKHATDFLKILDIFNLRNNVHVPTHTGGHTLDLIITRKESTTVRNVSADDVISDHMCVMFDMHDEPVCKNSVTENYRSLKHIDDELFRQDILDSNLVTSPPDDVNQLVTLYNSTLSTILDKHAPLKQRNIARKRKSPWYTEATHAARQKRRRLTRKWKRTRQNTDRDRMIEQRDKVRSDIEISKQEFYQQQIMNCDRNSKALFRKMKDLLGERKSNPLPQNKTDDDNANDFNLFFIDKIKKLKSRFDITHAVDSGHETSHITSLMAQFRPIDLEKTKRLVLSAADKSCDLDPVPTSIVKKNIDALAPVIQKIINTSISTGTVPGAFKTAIVRPLLKKPGLETVHKNYRPLSNLAFVSKLIEHTVLEQLEVHYKQNDLEDKMQSAYRPHHSTETAILHIVNDILRAISDRKVVCLAMLDLSAAFDTIDHNILLHRLEHEQGVTDSCIEWIESYLRNRTQRVKVSNSISQEARIDDGTVQGSQMGCKMYSKYVKPLGKQLENSPCSAHTYADDNNVWTSMNPLIPSEITQKMLELEHTLEKARQWMFLNKLCLNESKTELIVFGKKQHLDNCPITSITIGEATILPSPTVRNLGVHLDAQLNFSVHIDKVRASCTYQIHRAWAIRKFITHDAAVRLMLATVMSRLDYCNSVLIDLPKKEIQKLQRVQNAAARFVVKCGKYEAISSTLKQLHWLPVEYRIKYKLICIVHHCVYGDAPQYLKDLLSDYTPSRQLRSSSDKLLCVPTVNSMSTFGSRSFSVAGPKLWNAIPNKIRHTSSFESFKKQLKTHLFSIAF